MNLVQRLKFIKYLEDTYCYFVNDITDFRKYYKNNSNLYIFVDKVDVYPFTKYRLSFLTTDSMSTWEYDDDKCKYMGEFNSRKDKLEYLDKISK